jgi:ABC-type bacteriocin/lantibiotic exporter with double-glycine peptidase domain
MRKISEVIPYQQKTQHTCSAASLHAVLKHHGVTVPEATLAALIGTNKHGAELYQIVGAAKALGFDAKQVEFRRFSHCLPYLANDVPLICDVQSWTRPGSGHYCVLAGVDDGMCDIMDPNVKGNWRRVPQKDFDGWWWDHCNVYPGRVLRRAAVVVEPRG